MADEYGQDQQHAEEHSEEHHDDNQGAVAVAEPEHDHDREQHHAIASDAAVRAQQGQNIATPGGSPDSAYGVQPASAADPAAADNAADPCADRKPETTLMFDFEQALARLKQSSVASTPGTIIHDSILMFNRVHRRLKENI